MSDDTTDEHTKSVEYQALVALYDAMGGSDWVDSSNWCTDRPLSEWHGVYTYQGRVYAIELQNNNLVGTLPEQLAELKALKVLNLASNKISGSIPECYGQMQSLSLLSLYNNRMSGNIPLSLNNTPGWSYNWGYAILGNRYNRFNLYEAGIKAPILELELLSGDKFLLGANVYARNKYTILFQWSPDYSDFIPTLQSLYERYRPFGLEIISWAPQGEDIAQIVAEYGIEWRVAQTSEQSPLSQHNKNYYPVGLYPTVTMFDSAGELIFSDTVESRGNIVSVVDNLFAGIVHPDLYYSTDYSSDGAVTTLQSATEGEGIDIVLMGDGFSDRMVADGRYAERMAKAAEALFCEPPMSHFRNYFNIYAITVVSANELYATNATTALGCTFGEGTLIAGNNDRCFDYALAAVDRQQMDDTLIVVVLNSDKYAGTTYMYHPPEGRNDGSGAAIAYIPITNSEQMFRALICHEAVGHGFAKLDDEYTLEGMGAMPTDHKDYRREREAFGWLKNTDIYSSYHFVKWSHLLSLPRYTAAGLGIFEGASSYSAGVYRPTMESIMNRNIGGFNPPSREAIYQRIHHLAYGASWSYDPELFKVYDFTNLIAEQPAQLSLLSANMPLIPTHPPVISAEGWRK